jgi:hypothetical protein
MTDFQHMCTGVSHRTAHNGRARRRQPDQSGSHSQNSEIVLLCSHLPDNVYIISRKNILAFSISSRGKNRHEHACSVAERSVDMKSSFAYFCRIHRNIKSDLKGDQNGCRSQMIDLCVLACCQFMYPGYVGRQAHRSRSTALLCLQASSVVEWRQTMHASQPDK